jgi:hypothetical protein
MSTEHEMADYERIVLELSACEDKRAAVIKERDELEQVRYDLVGEVRSLMAERDALAAKLEKYKAEINARKGDPIMRLHNLCASLEEPLDCGHDLSQWCDHCETCGVCRDEKGPSAIGKLEDLAVKRDAALALLQTLRAKVGDYLTSTQVAELRSRIDAVTKESGK